MEKDKSIRSRFVIGGRVPVGFTVTPEQKVEIERRAAKMGISQSEFMLRAVEDWLIEDNTDLSP